MRQLQIPIFDIDIEDEALGLFGLSFVTAPAIQIEMHCFKDEPQKVFFASHEKREVVSPVILPNQLIYRESEGIPYYLRANAETIRKMYERYMLSGDWNNFTYQHENIDAPMDERALDGVYLQRLWIIEDDNDDAFTKYGFENLPKGTMMMKCKVNNRKIWSEIKEGNLRGISLEAFFDKINSNKALQITYSKMKDTLSLFQKFIAFLNETSQEADGVASEATKDETNSGEVSLKYFLDDTHFFEVDGEGFVRDENGELIAEGEYRLADGNVITVDSSSKFVGTAPAGDGEDEQIEAPIAEGFKEEEENKEEEEKKEDETEVDENGGEAEPKADDAEDEVAPKDAEDDAEDTGKEDEEDDEKKPTVNAIPFAIDGVEYLLPEEVINYIQSLQASKVEVEEKLTKLSEETPSAQPIGAVVKNGDVEATGASELDRRFEELERFKEWRRRRF